MNQKKMKRMQGIALLLALLMISMPIAFAQELNLVYDANGNLVSGDGYYREYNELNQLVRIRLGNLSTSPIAEEMTWHPMEERVLIKDIFSNGVKNYTIYYVSSQYVVIENSSGNFTEKYVYQGYTLLAQVNSNGQKEFIHPDNEGTSTLITSNNGSVLQYTFTSPFGELIEGGASSRYDYEAKEFDSLAQDYDFGFRRYKPDWGKFTQPDTIIPSIFDPQSLNRYSFEGNNPYGSIDPTGHKKSGGKSGGGFFSRIVQAVKETAKAVKDFVTKPKVLTSASTAVSSAKESLKNGYNSAKQFVNDITGYGDAESGVAQLGDTSGTVITYVKGGGSKSGVSNQELADSLVEGAKGAGSIGLFSLNFVSFGEAGAAKNAAFRSGEVLADHYGRHGAKLGYNSAEAYAQGAQDFLSGAAPSHTAEMIRPSDNALVRYNLDTQEFGVLDADGTTILTYMKPYEDPNKNLKYFLNQAERP